jgi:hypothetical protein
MTLVAVLALLLQAEEAPRRSPVGEGLAWLVAHQREGGSWGAPPPACVCRHVATPEGGDLESTAWALLALNGAGYSELSPDEIKGRHVGAAVRLALEWLISRQDADGAFDRKDAAANALATLVLTEYYGMTTRRKEPAEKAYGWVEKSEIADVAGRIRQGIVLASGRLSEIGHGHGEKILALAAALDREEGDLARWGSLYLKGLAIPRKPEKPKVEFEERDLAKVPLEALNVFVEANFILGDQEAWHKWFRGLVDVLVPLQRREDGVCEAGSWDGGAFRDRVRATAIRTFTLEHYRCFYCRNPFRKKE